MQRLLAQTTDPGNFGTYLQDLFQQIIGIDVMLVFRLLGLWVFIIWLVFALWVAIDASSRYKQWQIAVLWFLFVLPFNLLGLVGYLFMRPAVTLDENQWTKLESKYLMNELSSVNDCPTCGTLVPITHNFCAACGTQMNTVCPGCEASQSIYNLHCSQCGRQIGEKKETVVQKTKGEAQVPSQEKETRERFSALKKLGTNARQALGSIKKTLLPTKKQKVESDTAKSEATAEKKEHDKPTEEKK